ncbi:MAG: amino acid ABC transporter permease [Bacillota bacterium]
MSLAGFLKLLQPQYLLFLARGLLVSLEIAAWTIVLSLVGGIVLGVLRFSGETAGPGRPLRRWLGRLAALYVETFRNLPMLLLVLAARFWSGLPPKWAGVAGMTIFTSAVLGEVVRAGLGSIDRGQWEAAASQGFTYGVALREIILPQALRRMIPPIVSQFTTVLKDTAYVYMIGVVELVAAGTVIYAKELNPLETFFFIALIYFVINYTMSLLARGLERRLAVRSY